MPQPHNNPDGTFQAQFHQRWDHLHDPHVRALAWLLDAPDLLDPQAPQWGGKIASLPGQRQDFADWLAAIDRAPENLHAWVNGHVFTRLGRYAEQLMAFYFQQQADLFAYGLQVRAGKGGTVGEFDFLLRQGDGLLHLEFATKFYLLESGGAGKAADYFVGPNLADTLGAKMHKILDRQLVLGQHPAAQIHLTLPVTAARALIKGWLFYHQRDPHPAQSLGVSQGHCRGFWCTLAELDLVPGLRWAVLPRMLWLAPAKFAVGQSVDRDVLMQTLAAHFARDSMPVMVVLLEESGGFAREVRRGFVVPDDWHGKAGEHVRSNARMALAG